MSSVIQDAWDEIKDAYENNMFFKYGVWILAGLIILIILLGIIKLFENRKTISGYAQRYIPMGYGYPPPPPQPYVYPQQMSGYATTPVY